MERKLGLAAGTPSCSGPWTATARQQPSAAVRMGRHRSGCGQQRRLRTVPAAVMEEKAERATLDISKMQPIHDRLLIQPKEEEEKTAGGILLPQGPPKSNSDAHIGQVLAVGEAVDLPVGAGDTVAFQKYATAEVETPDGTELLFVAQKSILAKLE